MFFSLSMLYHCPHSWPVSVLHLCFQIWLYNCYWHNFHFSFPMLPAGFQTDHFPPFLIGQNRNKRFLSRPHLQGTHSLTEMSVSSYLWFHSKILVSSFPLGSYHKSVNSEISWQQSQLPTFQNHFHRRLLLPDIFRIKIFIYSLFIKVQLYLFINVLNPENS